MKFAIRGGGKEGQQGGHRSSRRHASSTTSSTSRPFKTYDEFASYMQSRKCVKCSNGLIGSEKDIQNLFQGWLTGQSGITSLVTCAKCKTPTCMGCGTKSTSKPGTQKNINGTQIAWCCSRGRLFLLWAFLCGFDMQYCAMKQREANTTRIRHRDLSGGVGYGGDIGRFLNKDFDLLSMGGWRASHQQTQDNFNQMVYLILQELLPSPERSSSFDSTPPEAVISMLLHSKILNNVAELLRNDSLDDATKRKDLYHATLGFLRIIGMHPLTAAKAVFNERERLPEDINLATLSFRGLPRAQKTNDTASSLADCLRNLNIQSNMMLKGAKNNRDEFQTHEGQNLLWLCRQISDLSQYLLANTAGGTGATVRSSANEVEDHGVMEARDDQIFSVFYYSKNALAIQQPPRGRMKRLITEITNLKTSLPSGIFVKHASSRLDVMKIVIVGPEGTPYENGLYEFDLFCPADYPQSPPKVLFRGTEGGCLAINPNLHADGKVCISLLNTYPGEPWRPGESTILQVLISIQAMIFCEQPYYNEPSMSMRQITASTETLNRQIKTYTVNYAILKWSEHPPDFWKDIVQLHFSKNGNKILRRSQAWAQEGPPKLRHEGHFHDPMRVLRAPPTTLSIDTLLPRLQRALQSYGATYVPSQNMGLQNVTQYQSGPVNGRRGYGGSS
ncbi:hypothetical protein P154DRAFT_485989 [Amniculicola lignicola CBS 123094]|uniref:UBC core domain-containing protein n=1 Tax=Amniculicola lignicola CBS 123094 TaxID=1392246 RepID=A0A6A5WQ39_9PLEO|nr:hypothetical protein P154DRAFT_485989 [Amniculicola lignicola CBS 123094]